MSARQAAALDISILNGDVLSPGSGSGGTPSAAESLLSAAQLSAQPPFRLPGASSRHPHAIGVRKSRRQTSRKRTLGTVPFSPQARIAENPDDLGSSPTARRLHSSGGSLGPEKRKQLTEVQLTRKFLQTEIDARMSRKPWAPTSKGSTADQGSELMEEETERKLFVVTARLPFTVIVTEEGPDSFSFTYESDPFDMNVADLLTSASVGRRRPAMKATNVVLVGEPTVRRADGGAAVLPEAIQEELDSFLRAQLGVVPVFPPPNRDSFANRGIFQLFHYSLPSAETGLGSHDWEGYELVNEHFRDVLLREYNRGDLMWINDYPLMLLPKMLRQERPDICIGFYLHCVFPSSEVYRILPQREEILRGVLSSNIIGFHNFEYAQQFLNSCIHVLGLECSASSIEACEDAGGTTTKVVTIQLGLHIEPYCNVLNEIRTQRRIEQFQQNFQGFRLLLAVDRLEEEKGIPHKIMAFHKLLQKDPQWAATCVFLQIVEAPGKKSEDTSSGPDENTERQEQILQQAYLMCGEVNSKFGTIGHLPVHFLCQEFDPVDLVALFAMADVMIDTPLRDMLSRSAYEFHLCQEESECGVLLLSEFSGSAQSLRAAALSVNPWDTNAFADAIQEALEMDLCDRVELHRYGKQYVQEQTLAKWSSNFLDELETAEQDCERERLQIPPQLAHEKPVSAMGKANRRILILGFLGTLVPHRSFLMTNMSLKMPQNLRHNLQAIAAAPNTHVIILSDLGRYQLAQALWAVPCWLIAEGGACYREPSSETWHMTGEPRDMDWLGPVKDIMDYFTARTPGSKVVEMSQSVSWHFNSIQGDHAAIQSKDLLVHLWAGPLHSAPAEAIVDKDSVTVRPTGTGKAVMLERLLQQICMEDGPDDMDNKWQWSDSLVLCIGDFNMRDEDIFSTVQKQFVPEGVAEQQGQHAAEKTELSFGDLSPAAGNLTGVEWEPSRPEVHNLEANSLSLGSGLDFSTTRFGQLHQVQFPDDGLPLNDAPLPKKSPSETDLPAADSEARRASEPESLREGGPAFFTCTVNRKATRAAYRLSDTNDVSFLIAQLAREVKHTKQGGMSGSSQGSGRSTPNYTGLDNLFASM